MQEGVKRLLKSQAAELAGMTQAGLSSAMKGGNPPPMAAEGYPCKEFGEWIRKRVLQAMALDAEDRRKERIRGSCTHPSR